MELFFGGDAGALSLKDLTPALEVRALQEALVGLCGIPCKQQLLSHGGVLLKPSQALKDLAQPLEPIHLTSFASLVKPSPLRIPSTEQRGIQLSQLGELLEFLTARSGSSGLLPWRDRWGAAICLQDLNLYHLADWVICPATTEDKCSYVELIASDAEVQRPQWFVSHAWQEPVQDFVMCLRGHGSVRQLQEKVAYWVCAYANNQHELGNDLRFNPRDSSFFRAMQLCGGVLLVLDTHATPFARVWCCFELAMALTDLVTPNGRLLLDIATVSQGNAQLLTDGLAPMELYNEHCVCAGAGGKEKAKREEAFPIELVQKALGIDIAKASASREVDRLRILNSIAGMPEEDLDATLPLPLPESRKECYEKVNRSLRSIFALASVSQVVSKNLKQLMPALCRALQEDSARRSIHLSFANSLLFKDADLVQLARALPPSLTDLLRLDLRSCHGLSDTSVLELAQSVGEMEKLRALFLDFYTCVCLTDKSVCQIFTVIQRLRDMRELDVNLRGLSKVTSGVIPPLVAALGSMRLLTKLHMNLTHTRQTPESAAEFAAALKQLGQLQILKLYFTDCPKVGDAAASALGDSIHGMGLKESIICFSNTSITDAGMAALCQGLGSLSEMGRSTLRFRACQGLTQRSLHLLGGALSALPSLQKLSIEVGKCRQIPRPLARRYAGLSPDVLKDPAFCETTSPKQLLEIEEGGSPVSPSSASQPEGSAEEVLQLFRRAGALRAENLFAVLRTLEPTLSRKSYGQLRRAAEAEDVESFLRWLLREA